MSRCLGTSFNVMNYTDEAKVEVALLKGKVKFEDTRNRQTRALVPGEVVRMDKASTSIVLTKEDVSRVSAWRTGYFYFENMSMEELVVKLERWYQVKFNFCQREGETDAFYRGRDEIPGSGIRVENDREDEGYFICRFRRSD